MTPANKLTLDVLNFLYDRGAYAWRATSIGLFDKKLGIYRPAAKKGVSDVLACYDGKLIAVEIKIGKDSLSPEQEGFQRSIRTAGGIALVVKDIEDFRFQFHRAMKEITIPLNDTATTT